VLLMIEKNLDYLFVFVVTEPDFDNTQLFSLLSGILLIFIDWLSDYDSCIEYLYHL
jgi:hypothetical protein